MLQLFSPAKINLFLQVVKRRCDGFHDLASLFQALNFGDWLSIRPSEKDRLTIKGALLPAGSSNLVVQALQLFRRKTGIKCAFDMELEKHIPLQAGLGGGSSNAASLLYGVNKLCGSPVAESDLQVWSAEIGSDVPFFFSQGTAFCQGRGEQVHALPPLPEYPLTIAKPRCGLATKEVFQALRKFSSFDARQACDLFYQKPKLWNDLQKPAFALKPQLRQLRKKLLACGYSQVCLSGSGTAFVCLGHAEPPAADFIRKVGCARRQLGGWYEL